MPKSKARTAAARPSGPQKTPVQIVRDSADALFRAALECCRQHDRVSRIHSKSAVEEELVAGQRMCEQCDEDLRTLTTAYEQAAANVRPTGNDEGWWHRANGLWLASREYLRRHHGCDAASREFKQHGRDQLEGLHTEYELEASALLALRHAAEAYQQDRPTAA